MEEEYIAKLTNIGRMNWWRITVAETLFEQGNLAESHQHALYLSLDNSISPFIRVLAHQMLALLSNSSESAKISLDNAAMCFDEMVKIQKEDFQKQHAAAKNSVGKKVVDVQNKEILQAVQAVAASLERMKEQLTTWESKLPNEPDLGGKIANVGPWGGTIVNAHSADVPEGDVGSNMDNTGPKVSVHFTTVKTERLKLLELLDDDDSDDSDCDSDHGNYDDDDDDDDDQYSEGDYSPHTTIWGTRRT